MKTAVQPTSTVDGSTDHARSVASFVRPPSPLEPYGIGYGEAHGHHGEILQGVFYSSGGKLEHGLVTLPCDRYVARARFRPLRRGPLMVEPANRSKALAAVRLTLDALGCTGWGGTLRIDGNVPLAWGCGSSTSDVLAAIRAVAASFGIELSPQWIARLAVAAETASDSTMYPPDRCMLFAQRIGIELLDLGGPLPSVEVLGFNTEADGSGFQTLTAPPIQYSWWEVEGYQPLLGLLRRAVEDGDPVLLGRVSTVSAQINQRHRPKRLMPDLLRLMGRVGAAGIQVAHSGTVAGFLFDPGRDVADRIEEARAGLLRLGLDRSWQFSTEYTLQHLTASD